MITAATVTSTVTTTSMQTAAPTSAPPLVSTASNRVAISVLAAAAGLVFFIVILLALCLAWRKWRQTRPATDVTQRDKSTYHMYSEIDHTTVILDEEPRVPHNQRVTEANDRAIPSAPSYYGDIPDTLVNENAYDMLHQKELVESKDTYSVLDPRLVDLNDPRLNTYDLTSDIIRKSANGENTSGTFEPCSYSEAMTPQVEPTPGCTSGVVTSNCNTKNSVYTDSPDSGQYFVLEKLPGGTESVNDIGQGHPTDSGSDNYYKLEPIT